MRRAGVFLAALLVLATSGCARQVEVDVEGEEAAIRGITTEWMDAANAKDVERMVSLYTDDASVFPPNAPLVTGTEGIRTLWSQLVESPGFATSLQTTEVEISTAGDQAYLVGTYEDTMTDPEGNPMTDRGKWLVVLKKQPDGAWKVVADIWNSDEPAAPATE